MARSTSYNGTKSSEWKDWDAPLWNTHSPWVVYRYHEPPSTNTKVGERRTSNASKIHGPEHKGMSVSHVLLQSAPRKHGGRCGRWTTVSSPGSWQRAFEPTGKPERDELTQGQPSITILSNLLPRSRPNDAHTTPHSVQHNSFPQTTIFPLIRPFSAMVCPPTHLPTRKLIDLRMGSRQKAGKFACPTRARSHTFSTARLSSLPGSLLPGYPRSRSKAFPVQNC